MDLKWAELDIDLDLPTSIHSEPPTKKTRQDGRGISSTPVNPYSLEKVGEKRFKKSAAVDTKFRVKLNDDHWKNKKLKNIHDDLYTMFEKVLAEAKQGFADNDSGRVVIEHPSLNNSIVVPLRPLEQLDAETVMQIIEKNIDQSRRARHYRWI